MKNLKWIIVILLILLGYLGYNYIYQEHRDISNETADFKMTSSTLLKAFQTNTIEAETIYLNNTILVTGMVSEANTTDITMDNAIFCSMTANIENASLNKNTSITIKGRCIGYDDLLEQVKFDQCTIINQ